MIYSIVGTEKNGREKAYKTLLKDKVVTDVIYNENYLQAEKYIDSVDLFGGEQIINLVGFMEKQESRDALIELFPKLKDSKNFFIIDEPFADANKIKRLEKYSEKVFDCREDKEGEASPFPMCNAFAKRDKKAVFVEWIKIKDISEPLEMIHGALWWKMRTIWEDTLNGKKTGFTLEECENFGEEIMKASMDAHRGEVGLKEKLEEVLIGV